jgi:hypothetical protein
MINKYYIYLIMFGVGVFSAWMAGFTDHGVKQSIGHSIDTTKIFVHDTTRTVDTLHVVKPKIVYQTKIIKDGISDSLQAIIVKLKQYEADQTFNDSAYVKHVWMMSDDYLVRESRWEYRPGPKMLISTHDTAMVYPSTVKKVMTGIGWFCAGAVAGYVAVK